MYLCDYYNKFFWKFSTDNVKKNTYLLNKIHFLKEKTYKKKLNTILEKKRILIDLNKSS